MGFQLEDICDAAFPTRKTVILRTDPCTKQNMLRFRGRTGHSTQAKSSLGISIRLRGWVEPVKTLEVILSSAIMSTVCLPSPGKGIAHLAKLVCASLPL